MFRALRDHWSGPLRFAMVASAWVGYGADWGRELLERYGFSSHAEIFVDIPQNEVNAILNASCCHVLCSLREGANRACFEALFAGIPALVPAGHVGFPHWRFPRALARTFDGPRSLVQEIRRSRQDADPLTISSAVAETAGANNALGRVECSLRRATLERGERWSVGLTPKVTRLHTCYRRAEDIRRHERDYAFLTSCSEPGFQYDAELAYPLLTR